MSARIIQVIASNDSRAGTGKEDDPYRVILKLYTLNGDLICSLDSISPTQFVGEQAFMKAFGSVDPYAQAAGERAGER